MIKKEALAAAKAAYDIEAACITQMKDYFDDEQFSKAVELLCNAPRIGAAGSGHSGIICFHEFLDRFHGHIVHDLGSLTDPAEQARRVFDALRTFDGTDVGEIWAQCPDSSGLGLAVGNRLKKAAGFHVIEV